MIYYLIQRLNHRWHINLHSGTGWLISLFMALELLLMLLLGVSLLVEAW